MKIILTALLLAFHAAGFMGGAHSDYDGIVGLKNLITSSAQRAAAFQALTTWKTYQQIPPAIANGAAEFMTTAEAGGVTFQFGPADFSDDPAVRSYVGGYAAGFTTEQICVAAVGAGIAAKAGTAAKVVLASTSTGTRVLDGVATTAKAVQRFKTLSVDFAINAAQKTLRTEQLSKAASTMADAVSKLSYGNGQTVGDVITTFVERLDIIHEELAKIGHPLDSFGVKAHAQLAKLLSRDLGYYPGEQAMRGNIRLFDKLVVGSGDRWDDCAQLFTKADATVGKDELKATLEAAKDEFDRAAAGERPRIPVKNYDQIYSDLYHHFSAANANRLEIRNGTVYLTEYSGDRGWYVTADKFDTAANAYDKLQLFSTADARYRARIGTSSVKDNLRLAYGDGDRSATGTLEPLTRDDPGLTGGSGGARQLLLGNQEAQVLDVWDTVEQRYLTQNEISALIYGQ